MPKQLNSDYNEVNIPFSKMSFTPDVPPQSLGPNEYNVGENIETDVRGIRSVAGDTSILDSLTGTPIYITGNYRLQEEWFFIVATEEGKWYAGSATTPWYDITPGGATFTGYTQATNITEAWNGSIPFFNDTINPPMFLPDTEGAVMTMYSNTLSVAIGSIVPGLIPTETIATFTVAPSVAPFVTGDKIVISGTGPDNDGTYVVTDCTTFDVTYTKTFVTIWIGGSGSVSPIYAWNFNKKWKSVTAGFLRLYNTPNVGSILVAGDLTATLLDDSTEHYPVTVQWSQAFGLNQAPLTWVPTITNVANQLEVPLRGQAIDGFPANGQFFLCSYWDTVVFSPINYSTTSAPILGVRLFNQGRGLLSSNCWANTDKMIYGVDARDIWVFDGNDFTGLGNQRIKNWFYDQLDPAHVDRVFMQVNTQKNQVEIYYPTVDAVNGVPNKVISYRYDLDVWNPPRDVSSATMTTESPIFVEGTPNKGSRTVVYVQGIENGNVIMKDQGYSFLGSPISSKFRRDNIKLLKDYSGKLMVHRLLPQAVNVGDNELPIIPSTGSLDIKVEGSESVGSSPTETIALTVELDTSTPWVQINQNSHRVNSIELSNISDTDMWMCTDITWQYTQTEDDR